MLSECCKLAEKEYKTRHNWAGKVIHKELCKILKFEYTNKRYIPKSESVLKNETHKIFLDFLDRNRSLNSNEKSNLSVN